MRTALPMSLGGGADVFDLAAEHQVFDLGLDLVVELVAVRAEEFDAVVGVGIVGGGDDDAGVGAQAAGDVGDAGRGQRADEEHIHAHGEDAGGDGVLEHVAGEAGVFADDDLVACRGPRGRDSRFLKTWPAARPSLRAVSAVTGSMLAVPRTPSVPKIFRGVLIGSRGQWYDSGFESSTVRACGRGAGWIVGDDLDLPSGDDPAGRETAGWDRLLRENAVSRHRGEVEIRMNWIPAWKSRSVRFIVGPGAKRHRLRRGRSVRLQQGADRKGIPGDIDLRGGRIDADWLRGTRR